MRRALLLATLLACGRGSPRATPSPLRIVPTGAYRGQAAHVRVTGDGFNARAVHQLGGSSRVDDRFRVRIGGVELENVAWLGTADGHQAIEADVPADLPAGLWDVEVTDPLGEAGTLRGGWTESDHVPPRLTVSAATPSSVEAGVAFDAEVRVQNQGGETALLSSVTLDGAPLQFGEPALLPGEVRALPVRRSAPAGSVWWLLAANGVDGITGEPLSAASGGAGFASLVPPRLAIAAGPLPAFVNAGQRVSIALTVHNEGEVAALSLLPALLVPAGVTVAGLQPQDVPAAAQVQYAATLTASSPGALGLQASASGVDGITGAGLEVAAQALGTVQVQRPAALSVSPLSAPAQVSRGQTFTAQVQIANTGEAAALGVQVTALPLATGGAQVASAAVAPFDLPGGGARTVSLTFTEEGTGPGTVQLQYSAAGTDANDAAAVTAAATSGTIAVQTPAALEVQAPVVPASIDRGQDFVVTAGLRNTGQAAAVALSGAIALATGGGAHASCGAAALPVSIPGGASAKVSFTCTEDGTGEGSLAATISTLGADANSGVALSATSPTSAAIAVQAAAALQVVSFPVPAAISRGQSFPVSLTVRNGGTATARGVVPDALSVVATGGAAVGIASKPAPVDLAGGQSATFTWSLGEDGVATGTLQLATTVRGLDGNTGVAVEAGASSTEVLVQTPAHLTVAAIHAPAAVSRGQTFTVEVTLENDGGASALGVAPQLAATGVTVVAAPAPQDIAGGAAATFTYQLAEAGTSPGTLQLSFSASGADVNSGSAVTAATTQATVVVQAPAALVIDSIPLPGRISRGMAVPLSVTIHNSGGASARGVTLSTVPLTTGGAGWTAGAAPAAFDLAGGTSATISLPGAESGFSDGSLAFSVSASGSDGNSGASIGASAASAAAVVEQPAALQAVLSMPSAVNEGQAFVVSLRISNTGEATAAQVTPQAPMVSSASGVVLSITGSPAPLDIAGGSSETFAWTASSAGTATGMANVSIGADGADANSGAALSTSGSGAVEVDPPSALTVTSFSVPEAVSRGQTFTATLVVHNGGGSTALNVSPSLAAAPVSGGAAATVSGVNPPVSLSPGTSATFSWQVTENGNSAGALRLDASASGTDSNNGATVSTAASSAVQVEEPARLSVVSFTAPSSIDRGQSFTVRLVVTNTGGALVKQVSAAPTVTVTGGAHAITSSSATPVDLGAGASATFSWSYQEDGTAAGTLSITARATGTEGNTGAALAVDSAPAGIAVQVPAALAASWTVPASAGVGTSFTATLTVANGGDAAAANVVPAATLSGPASLSGGPVPASATIAGGASATFTFTVSATAVGNAQLAATATGSDANTGAALSASAASALVALGEATTIATDPFCAAAGGACADTTTFAYLFSYQGQIYLGPNKTGTGAVRMAPDGSGPTQVNWQLEVNTDPVSAARNSAYQGSGAPLCHTIGAPNCKQGTTACGPDNESGHGIFLSGFAGTTEWYALTGASTIGGARYLYLTNPGLPLATGGYDDLAFVQVQAGQQGATRMATAGHFFNGKLYFALLDSGTGGPTPTAPVLNVLTRMPSLPGYAAALGTDLVNLQGVAMPAIGASGTPANSGTSWLMIDAITDFAGVLYLGNNGGLVRSANGNPAPCAGSCSDWVNVTPSAAAWGNKTSVTVSDSVLGTLEPAQRAIPGIASFGGRLFAARNTTAGPQLWSCAPAGGANPQQCDPSDWSLVAGASDLTQLGDAGNSAVTLLAASGAHLYVGFNNAAGLQIWRTANANAAALPDFTGRADCVAGTSGCGPVGGAGLGNASTRIFDGKVLTLGGQDWLYVSAGDGATAPKVSRIVP